MTLHGFGLSRTNFSLPLYLAYLWLSLICGFRLSLQRSQSALSFVLRKGEPLAAVKASAVVVRRIRHNSCSCICLTEATPEISSIGSATAEVSLCS